MKMFECQLCGGRIRNGRCELCGWVNQSESDYLLNKSSCDTKPLTHIHKENTYGSWKNNPEDKRAKRPDSEKKPGSGGRTQYPARDKTPGNRTQNQTPKSKKKGRGLSILVILITLLGLAPSLFQTAKDAVGKLVMSSGSQKIVAEDSYQDLYSYVTRELPETGEKWSMELWPGIYRIGVDIPEGLYHLEAVGGRGSFYLDDEENFIYYSQYLTSNPTEKEDINGIDEVRLYKNASVHVKDSLILKFSTDTGQTDQLESLPNPITEEVLVPVDTEVYSGDQFAAGVYDLTVRDTWTNFVYETPIEGNSGELEYHSVFLDSEYGEDGVYTFKNVELPQGTRVYSEDADVELIPGNRVSP